MDLIKITLKIGQNRWDHQGSGYFLFFKRIQYVHEGNALFRDHAAAGAQAEGGKERHDRLIKAEIKHLYKSIFFGKSIVVFIKQVTKKQLRFP